MGTGPGEVGVGVWAERGDGWAPPLETNTPCLEVCWVLDPCLELVKAQ